MLAGLNALLGGSYRDKCCVCGIRGKDDVDPVLGFPASSLRSPSGSRSASRSRASSRSSSASSGHSGREATAPPASPALSAPPVTPAAKAKVVAKAKARGVGRHPDDDHVPLQLKSFDQREDFEDPAALAVMAEDAADEVAVDRSSQCSEQRREDLLSASANLSLVIRRERRAIQRMRHTDEAAAEKFWRDAKEEDYKRKSNTIALEDGEVAAILARREKMTAYLEEREAQRANASANLDSIEKNMAVVTPSACSPLKGSDATSGARSGAASGAAAAGPLALPGIGAGLGAVPEKSDGRATEVEEDGAEDAEVMLKQYEETNVTGKIASLRKRMVSQKQLPMALQGRQPGPGDPEALKEWNRQVDTRNEQIRSEVKGYQQLMRGKLDRMAAHPGDQSPRLRATVDPANAVRDAVLKYHRQCLKSDAYYATGWEVDGTEAMGVEQRVEIEAAVAALELQNSVLQASVAPPQRGRSASDKSEASSRRLRFVTTSTT